MDSFKWEKPVDNLEQALKKVSDNCTSVQFKHRLDPYSQGVNSFERSAGDKIVNPHIGDAGVRKLCEKLQKNSSVRAIDLSANKIGYEGIQAICKLLKENETIEILYLEDNQLGDEECELIAERLYKNKGLKKLSLSGNLITSKGAKALASALQKNETLEALWLNRNQIRDGGAKMFGSTLKSKNKTLNMLCLEDNKIRERGAKVLAKGLRKNVNIKTVNLGRNKIGAAGVKFFSKTIAKNGAKGGKLNTLILEGNRFNEDDVLKLGSRAAEKNIKLQGSTHYDIYGDALEHKRKQRGIQRMRNYLRYHTKPIYWKQGHFDPEKKIEKQL